MPAANPTRSGRTRRTTRTVRRHADATRRSGRLLGHLSWLSCGQWPAQTWVFVDQTASAGLQVEATTSAIAARVAVVVGARLGDDTAAARSGAPDVLVCARGGYVAVDVKHHRTINAGDAVLLTSTLAVPTPTAAAPLAGSQLRADKDDALQLAHYRRMLQTHGAAAPTSLGGIIGKERLVVWYDLDEAMWTTSAKSDGKRRKPGRNRRAVPPPQATGPTKPTSPHQDPP